LISLLEPPCTPVPADPGRSAAAREGADDLKKRSTHFKAGGSVGCEPPIGVSLTKAGERLLPYAKRISHLVDLARDTVRQDEDDICRRAAAETSPTLDHQNACLPERPVEQACIAVATAEPQAETPG
jgi:hypothetical protein